ncbi:MAG: TolC family protein [Bacteroidota bacterium]
MKRLICIALLWSSCSFVWAQSVRIGVISDLDESENLDIVLNQMIREIDQTTGSTRKVMLDTSAFGMSGAASVLETYRRMEGRIDLVLSIGSISGKVLSAEEELPIPVIALGIIDPELQDIPYVNGTSGKDNFSYVWQTRDLENELRAFQDLYEFRNLAIFVDEKVVSTVNTEKSDALTEALSSELNTRFSFIPVGNDMDAVINQIPADADAAYFTVMLGLQEPDAEILIKALNERNLPSFSGSASLIELGVLGSLTNQNNLDQGIRKLAIMVDGFLNGAPLSGLSVALDTKENLYINIATAREIELPIPFDILFTATITGDDDRSVKTYSFEEIAAKSLEANLNIRISYQDIELSELDIQSVRSNLLPSLSFGMTGSQINEERANAAFNSPERSLSADLDFTQLLYSENAIAAYKIAGYLNKAQEFNTEAEVLSVLLDTYVAYLNVLSSNTNVIIQRENLVNTKKNKELASIRVNLGASTNSDLYRWETELALSNQAVIEAQATLLSAKLQLNNLLANTLESEFDLNEVSLSDEWLQFFDQGQLSERIRTPRDLELISNFFVEESQRNNPNKKALLESINATNRQLTQNKRLMYIPTVALQAQTSQVLQRGGVGSTIDASAMALGISEFQDNSWFVGVSLSFPIFDGFSRTVAIQQSRVSLDQQDQTRVLLDQNLELGVRSSVLNVLSTSTNIEFTRTAAESAQKNFELVQDNYTQGQVTITQLIDAQQAALEARLASELSVFQYVQARLQLEFNVGSFTIMMTEEERQDFNNRLQNTLNSTK